MDQGNVLDSTGTWEGAGRSSSVYSRSVSGRPNSRFPRLEDGAIRSSAPGRQGRDEDKVLEV